MRDSLEKPAQEPIADIYRRLKEERVRIVPTFGEDCGWPYADHVYDKPTDLKLLMAQTVKDRGFNVLIQPEIREHKLGGYYFTTMMNIWVDRDARNWLNQIKSCPEVTMVSRALFGGEPEMDSCAWTDEDKKKVEAYYLDRRRKNLDITINSRFDRSHKEKALQELKVVNARIAELKNSNVVVTIDDMRNLVAGAVDKEIAIGKNPDYWD